MELLRTVDPTQLELSRHLFASIAEEMGVTLGRTAFSPNIKERRDYSCALFDTRGRMIAQAAHIPVHLGSMPLSVQSALERVEIEPGDMVVLNDPFAGGTHLPDVTLVAPVIVGSEVAFFVANRAHHADVGGMSPGSMPLATHIIQEGLRLPPVKLYRRGELDRDILAMILANVRTPEERRGDLEAQIAANRVGIRRLQEAASKRGLRELQTYAEALQQYAARRVSVAIGKIPDGVYTFRDQMDDDGITDEPVPICVKITIDGEHATVDFTGSAPQTRGSINAVSSITLSAVFYVFRCLAGSDVPSNSGCLDPIRVILPEGSVVHARFPAAVAGGNVETSQRIVDVLLGALGQACPELVPAASSGSMNNVTVGGWDPYRQRPFAYYETIGGGMGARPHADGLHAIHTHMTNTANTPIEAIETTYPLRVERYAIRRGSGGAGRTRGGDGIVRCLRMLCPCEVTILSDRRRFAPYGVRGGKPGAPGRDRRRHRGQWEPLASKTSFQADAGDILCVETPGGGGYGRPG